METIGAYEAKTHLPKLLERVIKGERITITKTWRTSSCLQPPPLLRNTEPKKVIAELPKFREKHILNGLPIRDMIEEGRQ